MTTQTQNETAARCRKCDRVYLWVKHSRRELVRDAWCPYCALHLKRTAVSLICSASVRFVRDVRPYFGMFKPMTKRDEA